MNEKAKRIEERLKELGINSIEELNTAIKRESLNIFDIKSLSDNKYEAQTAFTWTLHEMAQKYDIHIMFVAHPRKAMGFLRLDDISGTADIGNAVDNAFIVHRVNNDFKRLSMQMFGWKADDDLYTASNVIEIAEDFQKAQRVTISA